MQEHKTTKLVQARTIACSPSATLKQHGLTRSTRLARHVELVESSRDETWRAKWNLGLFPYRPSHLVAFCNLIQCVAQKVSPFKIINRTDYLALKPAGVKEALWYYHLVLNILCMTELMRPVSVRKSRPRSCKVSLTSSLFCASFFHSKPLKSVHKLSYV